MPHRRPLARLARVVLPTLSLALFALAPLAAQTVSNATLTGVVTDDSGAVVPDVALTLADPAQSVQRRVTSDAQGVYVFAGLPPGTYALTAGGGAFAPVRIESITLAAGDARSLPVRLTINPVTENVSVTAANGYEARVVTVGKLPVSPREIPQSVTVITRQVIEDQNMTTLREALQFTPGVSANPASRDGAESPYFNARGYSLDVQYDGTPSTSGVGFRSQPDLALFERVEVWRGPAGLLQGVGEPGGTVNLVRKRPSANFAVNVNLLAGSWDNYHGDVDVTGRLNRSGTLRGRAVIAAQDRGFFYDTAYDKRQTYYGIVEYDLTDRTVIGASAMAQRARFNKLNGFPTYADGSLLDIPRSMFLGADWGEDRFPLDEYTVDVTHRLPGNWLAKANLRYRDARTDYRYAMYFTSPPPGSLNASILGFHGEFSSKDYGGDVTVSGPISLFGRQHTVLVGYNRAVFSSEGGNRNTTRGGAVIGDGLIDASADLIQPVTNRSGNSTTQSGLYGVARLKLHASLTAVIGARMSDYSTKSRATLPETTPWTPGAQASNEVTPYGGLVWDLSKAVTLYTSYSDIFVPTTSIDYKNELLPPRVGWQAEGGAKAAFFADRLHASVAFYRIRDTNRVITDPDHIGCGGTPDGACVMAAGLVQSQGWETEVNGQLTRGWSIFGGYTRTVAVFLNDSNASNIGQTFSGLTPKHQLKLWTRYAFSPWHDRLSVGGGINAQSRIYSGVVKQGSYALVSVQAGFRLTGKASLSLTVNNLFDTTYLAALSVPTFLSQYGEPRSVMLALRTGF